MREHCLTQLNKALEENNRHCPPPPPSSSVSLGKLEAAAVYLEYSVFLAVKSVQMYKLTVHKKVDIPAGTVGGGHFFIGT